MDRAELMRRSWRAYQEINYQPPRMDHPIPCLLIMVNFDDELMILQPISTFYKKDDFHANISYCSVPPRKPRAAYVNNKKVVNNPESRLRHDPVEDVDYQDDFDDAS